MNTTGTVSIMKDNRKEIWSKVTEDYINAHGTLDIRGATVCEFITEGMKLLQHGEISTSDFLRNVKHLIEYVENME